MATLLVTAIEWLGMSCLARYSCSIATRLCCCAMNAGGKLSPRAGRTAYLAQMLVGSVLALVLYGYGDQISWLRDISVIRNVCTANGTTVNQCFGTGAVLRISFAQALYFAVVALGTSFSASAFVGCWGIKTLAWLGTIIGCFYVPTPDIARYSEAAAVFSALFLILMAVNLIDFTHHAQEWFTRKAEAKEAEVMGTGKYESVGICQNKWAMVYLAACLACVAASMTGLGMLFKFSNDAGPQLCSTNISFLSVNLILGLTGLAMSPLEAFGARGLLTPALVWAYNVWQVWSGIHSNPEPACNPAPADSSSTAASIIGMLLAAGSLIYTTVSASAALPNLFHKTDTPLRPEPSSDGAYDDDHAGRTDVEVGGGSDARRAAAPLIEGSPSTYAATGSGVSKAGRAHSDVDEEDDQLERDPATGAALAGRLGAHKVHQESLAHSPKRNLMFGLTLVLASLYMAMVVTNWSLDPTNPVAGRNTERSMYVSVGSSWVVTALYLWTLVAPKVCPNRQFD